MGSSHEHCGTGRYSAGLGENQVLASKILQSLETEPTRPKKSLRDLVGILATDQPPPTDEDVERILEEERMRKYG
jgi:hypothetical protein